MTKQSLLGLGLTGLLTSCAFATNFYVDSTRGDDAHAGTSWATAWKTIGQAAATVQPGDAVMVGAGIYYESVQLKTAGTAEKPIRFTVDAVQRNRVIITGADRAIREKKAAWTVDDAALGLYSIPIDYAPARVMADEVDLFAYPDLASLKSFELSAAVGIKLPGPAHGFAHDPVRKRLCVRLEASGKYGPPDLRKRTLQVSPASGSGGASQNASEPAHMNFGIRTSAPAYVTLEGFTFETPGVCGVFLESGNVTIRDCWFRGCRTAVAARKDGLTDVLIERCEFSQYPTFHDVADVIARLPAGAAKIPAGWWLQRGNGPLNYGLGFVFKAGTKWTIRGNYIHDCYDGLSSWSLGTSRGAQVTDNVFERIVDNGIETGRGAADLQVDHNFFKDVREVFAYNPKEGPPWPGPILIHHNTVTASAEGQKLWAKLDLRPALFELHGPNASAKSAAAPMSPAGAGFVAYHNTLLQPEGLLFQIPSLPKSQPENFRFLNNLIVTEDTMARAFRGTVDFSKCEFAGNLLAPAGTGDIGPDREFAGSGGASFRAFSELKLPDAGQGNFAPAKDSPAAGKAVKTKGLPDGGTDIGAFAASAPSHLPTSGPKLSTPAPQPTKTASPTPSDKSLPPITSPTPPAIVPTTTPQPTAPVQ